MADKKFSNFIGSKKKFHPEVTQRYPFKSLMGKTLKLIDADILVDFGGKFGRHDAALMLFNFAGVGKDGKTPLDITFTTIDSGVGLVDQIRKLIAKQYFPVTVLVGETEKEDGGKYHALLVPPGETPDVIPDTPDQTAPGQTDPELPF